MNETQAHDDSEDGMKTSNEEQMTRLEDASERSSGVSENNVSGTLCGERTFRSCGNCCESNMTADNTISHAETRHRRQSPITRLEIQTELFSFLPGVEK